jgi:hypothetical protein
MTMILPSLRPLVAKSCQRGARQSYSNSRRSRQNLQHVDYGRQRHAAKNQLVFGLVFGAAMIMGVGSAVIMSRCEKSGKSET